MNFKVLIFASFILISGLLNAQTDFRPGFVVDNSGDTLYGEIDYRGDEFMAKTCRFKDANGTIKEFFPYNISAYRFIDSKYYVSREIVNKQVFLEYLIKGKVNIYYLRNRDGDHYYLDKDTVRLTKIPYETGVRTVDNKKVHYESTRHIGILNYYMQDAPKMKSQTVKIKRPEHRNLIKLAENYHNTLCQDEQCIVYDKNTFVKVNFELAGGVTNFENIKDLNDKYYFQGGLLAHIWMPRTNEKIYFKTGILYSKPEYADGKYNLYKIPLHLEYIYPKGIIRPRLSYGFNFYNSFNNMVSFNVGANIKITKSLFFSVTSDIEFLSDWLVVPVNFLSHSVHGGLYIKL